MRESRARRVKKGVRSGLVVALILLIMLELCSVTLAVSHLVTFSPVQNRNYISLTESSKMTKLMVSSANGSETAGGEETSSGSAADPGSSAAAPSDKEIDDPDGSHTGLVVEDRDQIWTTETDVDIFSIRYDSEAGHPTFAVNSEKGDNVFAPGTEQAYTFTVKNVSDHNMKYTLTVDAYYENTDGLWIPIEGRLKNDDKGYVIGSETEWPDVLELDGYAETNNLSAGYIRDYTLDWRWPFERFDGEGLDSNDAYDTMLGNLAVDEDLSLHIIIRIVAEWDEEGGGVKPIPPQTGDYSKTYLWGAIAVVSLCAIGIVIWAVRRDDDDEKEKNGLANG